MASYVRTKTSGYNLPKVTSDSQQLIPDGCTTVACKTQAQRLSYYQINIK